MLIEEFDSNSDSLVSLAKKVRDSKRPDYTLGKANVLSNFDSTGSDVDLPPEKVLWILLKKHLDAILATVRDPSLGQSEPIDLRFADAINYLLLLYSIIKRRDGDKTV